MVFRNWQAQDSFSSAIWISLVETLTGDLDFEQIVMEMLMVFVLGSRLEGKEYLIVLDSIWHINRDWWYLKLGLAEKNSRLELFSHWIETF